MAKPLKPFVRGGGYYPSSRWTPLVYPGGYTTANGNGAEPTPLIKTVKGAIAHVTDALAMPAIGLKCEINPLQAGTGDPSPTNVRPISGWTGCNVTRAGKNLWKPLDSQTINGVTLTVDDYGGCSLTGTATANANFIMPVTILPGSYYLSAHNSDIVGTSVRLMLVSNTGGADKQIYLSAANAEAPITLDTEYNQLRIRVNVGTAFTSTKFYPQLELGSNATDYEPYQGNIYPITFPDSAATVYGGTLDVVNKKLTVGRTIVTLNSSDNWQMHNTYRYAFYLDNAAPGLTVITLPTDARFACNRYKIGTYINNSSVLPSRDNFSVFNQTSQAAFYRRIWVKDTNFEGDLAGFKASLAQTGLQIVYPLTTPIVYDVTVEQITTLLGTNNIWHDANGDTELTYYAE